LQHRRRKGLGIVLQQHAEALGHVPARLPVDGRIVEQHLGRIMVESEVGRGTTVTVRLPIEREVT